MLFAKLYSGYFLNAPDDAERRRALRPADFRTRSEGVPAKKKPRLLIRGFRTLGSRGSAIHLPDLEPRKTPDGDVFTQLGDSLVDKLLHRGAFILDEVLFVEAVFFVEFFHLAVDDLLDHGVGLAGGFGLRAIDVAFAVEGFLGHFLAAKKSRVERGDVHRNVVAEPLKILGPSHEIALAVDFGQHSDLAARVDVAPHQAFGGGPLRLLLRGRLPLLAQDVDGLLDVAIGFDQRIPARRKARAGSFSQMLLPDAPIHFPFPVLWVL